MKFSDPNWPFYFTILGSIIAAAGSFWTVQQAKQDTDRRNNEYVALLKSTHEVLKTLTGSEGVPKLFMGLTYLEDTRVHKVRFVLTNPDEKYPFHDVIVMRKTNSDDLNKALAATHVVTDEGINLMFDESRETGFKASLPITLPKLTAKGYTPLYWDFIKIPEEMYTVDVQWSSGTYRLAIVLGSSKSYMPIIKDASIFVNGKELKINTEPLEKYFSYHIQADSTKINKLLKSIRTGK